MQVHWYINMYNVYLNKTAGNNSYKELEAQLGRGLKSRMIFSKTWYRSQKIRMWLNKDNYKIL